ncbi:MAG TPA: hypothetical protein PLT08_18625 [Anaerolineales bacterium]|nr:hypothetical protein [Anaerolineales bacterium]
MEPKWSPRKYSTLIYAKAHDQTVAEDYFQAMQRVEQRLNASTVLSARFVPVEKNIKDVKVQNVFQLIESLALPDLCQEERLEIVGALKMALD